MQGCNLRPRDACCCVSLARGLEDADSEHGRYRVVLQGMTVAYDVLSDSTVMVRRATMS